MNYQLPLSNELIVDNFAGGGGASIGIEMALGRPVNIAVNHDPEAVALHIANHPLTRHYCEDVWSIDPALVCRGRPVALAWFSPDCKHFSKAKGGKPVEKKIRGLAWVVLRWAAKVKPRVICLENVEEFTTWGPIVDGRPCPERKGQTFKAFVNALKRHGYRVEWRELRACDYGAPTIRKRLFMIARRDGQPIRWPEPTHGEPGSSLKPYRTAAECIDWDIPCPSIFERKRPLAENTMRRIARGIERFVIEAEEPFLLNLTHGGRLEPASEPFRTITAARRGEKSVVVPSMIPVGYGERKGQAPRTMDIQTPFNTVVASANKFALVAAFLAKHFGGATGCPADTPMPTILSRGTQTQLVISHIMKMYGTTTGSSAGSRSNKHAEVRAFLMKYYGNERDGHGLTDPIGTVTTRDRFGLVTIHGEQWAIADIGMRMLQPRELYRAQGFPDDYVIDIDYNGRPLTKTAQVRMCGNSVCPPLARAIVAANVCVSEIYSPQKESA